MTGTAGRTAIRTGAALVSIGVLTACTAAVGEKNVATPRDPAARATGSATQVPSLEDSDCAGGYCLVPGQYRVRLGQDERGSALSALLDVEGSGWQSKGFQHRLAMGDGEGAVRLAVYRPHLLATSAEPCAEATTPVADEATADDVAGLLAALPQFDLRTAPAATAAFGRETHHLELAADSLSCPASEGDQYNLADIYGQDGLEPGGDSDIDLGRPVTVEFWVLDLGGHPIVVEARQEANPHPDMVDQLDAVRASLRFTG